MVLVRSIIPFDCLIACQWYIYGVSHHPPTIQHTVANLPPPPTIVYIVQATNANNCYCSNRDWKMSVKISTVAENLASCWHGMVAWSVVLPGTCSAPHTLLSLYLVIPVPVAAPPTWWCVRKQVDFMFKLYSVIRRHFATSLCKYPTATLFFPTRVTRPKLTTIWPASQVADLYPPHHVKATHTPRQVIVRNCSF